VLGFLSVSTSVNPLDNLTVLFQSRAGFSECLDTEGAPHRFATEGFQSRAGFSECLDLLLTGIRFAGRGVSIPCWVF